MRTLVHALVLAFALTGAGAPALAGGALRARAPARVQKSAVPRSKKRVLVLVGMPGSGKTYVSKKLAGKLGLAAPLVSGDIIREAVGPTRNAKEQGEKVLAVARKFAKMKGEIGRRMALKARKTRGDTVIIEGFRSPADLASFRKAFPNTVVVALDVPTRLRHERQLARGRAGEDNVAYLNKRDAQERRQGLGRLIENADLRVRITSNDPAELDRALQRLAGQVTFER